jgi:hypothetical protein
VGLWLIQSLAFQTSRLASSYAAPTELHNFMAAPPGSDKLEIHGSLC